MKTTTTTKTGIKAREQSEQVFRAPTAEMKVNYINATPTLPGMNLVQPFRFSTQPREYKVVSLRDPRTKT